MLRTPKIKYENFDHKVSDKTKVEFSKSTPNEKICTCVTNFFKRLTCSDPKLTDDETEILVIHEANSK